ncbi:MAG: thioesterase family protein [Panacagrimonas sp.]
MLFSQVLGTLRADGEFWCADAPASWGQGRTLFGGLQAALLVAAMRRKIPFDIPLRSLQTSFIGPVPAGQVRIEVKLLRQGKSAIHVQAHTVSDEGIGCTALAVFGRARASTVNIEPLFPSFEHKPENIQPSRHLEGLTPPFIQFVDQRWASGGKPYSGANDGRTQIYVRYPGEPAVAEGLVIAVADTIPSPALSTLKTFAVASSMCWTLEFLVDDIASLPDGHWLVDAEATAARDGYVYQTATVWSPDHRAVALSRQSVVVFG